MNIKQFLKPNRKKIIIFIIILILLVIFRGFFLRPLNALSLMNQYAYFVIVRLIMAPFFILTFPFYFFGEFGSFAIIGLIIGIIGLIFWYLISCFIVWVIGKFKNKPH